MRVADGSVAADVAVVAIGRNEGERLVACLASPDLAGLRVVYVDSGSTDGSRERARAAGAQVVALDISVPFTAARARNAGVAEGSAPARFIQFVDGDCVIEPGWIAAAQAFLKARPDVAAVCGRRRERWPAASVYNRLCDMEWNTPPGEATACGGDALMRRDAFEAVGGFDATLIAGEEPELCLRLRRAGWRIWRLDRPMTLHDAAMTRFGQWWRRAMRAGWTYAEGADRHGAGPERYNRRRARSAWVWGAAAPAAALACAAGAAAGLGAAAVATVAIIAAYPVMAARVAQARRRERGDPWPAAALYGAFVMAGKLPEALGQLRYALRRRDRAQSLIEYK